MIIRKIKTYILRKMFGNYYLINKPKDVKIAKQWKYQIQRIYI